MNSDVAVAFMTNLLTHANASGARWGTALLQAQQWALSQGAAGYNADLGRTEQLFGDPAMQVFGTNGANRPTTPKTPLANTPSAPGTF